MTGVQIFRFEADADPVMDKQYRNDPSYLNSLRSTAGAALADMIMRGTSLYRRIDPPDKEHYDPRSRVKHIWEVGVQTSLDEISARKADMDAAKAEGRSESAAAVLAAAARYRNLPSDGHCKWVIASALEDAARQIQQL